VKHWRTALAIFAALSVSVALAEDFKTINGKEYKDATVSRVEPDGIVLKTKSGITKVYFVELPKEAQERFGYNLPKVAATQPDRPLTTPATFAPINRSERIGSRAAGDASRQTGERLRQLHAPVGATQHSDLPGIIVFATVVFIVGGIIVVVLVVNDKQRRERRAFLFKQAREWVAGVQQNHALPVVRTNIILKPGESAFYSTPSTLYETRAVRTYQAAHTGFRVAKGVYVGGTSGRSISTQQWARLDTGSLTISNKRLVFVGGKEGRTIPLSKVVSVENNLGEILIAVEGRQKAIALTVPNPLIASVIIRLCSQVNDPLNLSGDTININFKE
jgi:hypothetical protein